MPRKRKRIELALIYAGYIVVSIFFIFPLFWVISLSFKSSSEIFSYPPSLIPEHPTFGNFIQVWQTTSMPKYLLNSFILVIFTVIGTLAVSIPAGYSFSRFHFRNKSTLLFTILIFQMISPIVIVIPIYLYFSKVGLLDNYTGLIMVYIATQVPFSTWLLKGYFDSIPIELEEAARVDGATRMQALFKIILPISVSGIASTIIFISVNAWSQFILPFILISNANLYPVSVGILMAQGTYQQISIQLVAAASVLALLPSIVLVLVLQKFIIAALTEGAVKG